VDVNHLHYRQIAVYGTFSSAPRHNALALEMIRGGKVSARKILTHLVSLDNICAGMDLVSSHLGLRVAVAPFLGELQEEIKRHPDLVVVR
jgi:L-iditol 2-dehydrogenase